MKKLPIVLICSLVFPSINYAEGNNATADNGGFFSNLSAKVTGFLGSNSVDAKDEKQNLIKQIQKYSLSGDYKNSETSLNEYKNKYGEDESYLTEKARYLALTNQSRSALQLVNEMLAKNPNDKTLLDIKIYALSHKEGSTDTAQPSQGHNLDANANVKTNSQDDIAEINSALLSGDYNKGRELLDKYKSVHGEDEPYLIEQARYLALTHHSQEALQIVEPLLVKHPTNKTLHDIKEYAKRNEPKTETITETKTETKTEIVADTHGQVESQSVTEKQDVVSVNESIKKYKAKLHKNPNDKEAMIALINTHLQMGDYYHARHNLKIYKKKFGSDETYLTEKARYFALKGKYRDALKVTKPLIKKYPENKTIRNIHDYAAASLKNQPADRNSILNGATVSHQNQDAGAVNVEASQERISEPTPPVSHVKPYAKTKPVNNVSSMKVKHADQAHAVGAQRVRVVDNTLNELVINGERERQLDHKYTAYYYYSQAYMLAPNNPEVVLGLARTSGRYGETDESVDRYCQYLRMRPTDRKIWLEYAYMQSWRGNFRDAIKILDNYELAYGRDQEYLIERARVLATANRPTESLAITNALLPSLPENYDLHYAKTVSQYYNHQPIEMFQSLNEVNRLSPESEQTAGLNDFIRTPFKSNIGLDYYHSSDSDTIKINRATLLGQYYLSPVSSLVGNIAKENLYASHTSGLNPIEGGHSLNLYSINGGANYRLNPHLFLQGIVGGQHADDDENAMTYQADAFITITDTLDVNLLAKRSFYDVSPRAVSLGVKRNLNQMDVLWEPCVQCYVNLNGSYSTFSDSNTETYASLLPAVQVLSTQWYNLRLGVNGTWYQFSEQYNNGYYNPENYRYYGFIADVYIKQSDNVGYEVTLGLGTQKDETFTSYTPANDLSAKAYFGIYKDWYFVLSGAGSTRGRSIGNAQNLGDYRIYSFDAMLLKRFD